ncbi:MAG: fused response regulator/phosphatase [Acidimicrobiales bacterium]
MAPSPASRDAAAPRDAAHTVLLIEDDDADTLLFRDGVGEIDPDLSIRTAASLEEADSYLREPLDCIVLDLGLPGTIDLDALMHLRRRTPDVAIVVLTGWGDERIGTAAVATGAQDYLIKGEATPPTIARSIRFAIERKRNERSTAMLLRSELKNAERERLERALLATPSFRRDDFSWVTRYSAARTGVVSGDFLDGVELPDGTIRAVIGDVAGHGPDEAALGVSLRAAWRALVLSSVPSAAVLSSLEDLLVTERSTRDAYATVCDILITPNLRTVEVRSAGHPPPILASAGPLVDANLRSPLGMKFGDRTWAGTTFDLPERWSLALYTDGLFEIRSDGGGILSVDDVPGAVDHSTRDGVIDPDALLGWFESRSNDGWRDDVALAIISSRAWDSP